MMLQFWKDLNRIQQSMELKVLEIMVQKYGIFYKTNVNPLHNWVILRI